MGNGSARSLVGEDEAALWCAEGQSCGLALSRQRGLFQEPKSQAKGEGLWRLQQGKKRKAPFGLGENQETRGTTAKEIVREVCALWFLARKRRGAAVGLRVFAFFKEKGRL
ncbi:hypothetical protein BDE02_08G071100 [Populus trichocarpa]|nr:hypothetical protein BDE02_08G071100 [Populus trichocarpa]